MNVGLCSGWVSISVFGVVGVEVVVVFSVVLVLVDGRLVRVVS